MNGRTDGQADGRHGTTRRCGITRRLLRMIGKFIDRTGSRFLADRDERTKRTNELTQIYTHAESILRILCALYNCDTAILAAFCNIEPRKIRLRLSVFPTPAFIIILTRFSYVIACILVFFSFS